MTDATGRPDSTKLYRGTGYSLALGTGTLGTRLEKAGAAGMISSRNKLSGFTNPFPAAGGRAGAAGGRGGRGGAPAGGGSMRGGGPGAAGTAANAGRGGFGGGPGGAGGWGVIEIFESYNTIAPAVTLMCEDYSLVYRLAEHKQKPKPSRRARSTKMHSRMKWNLSKDRFEICSNNAT